MKDKILKEFSRAWDRYIYMKTQECADDITSEKRDNIINQCEIEMNLLSRLADDKCKTFKF